MFTHNDLIDVILQTLRTGPNPAMPARGRSSADAPAQAVPPPPAKGPKRWKYAPETGPAARQFLTEAAIKKALTPGARRLTIPHNAIISPLASDWLALDGIEIVRE